MLKVLIVPKMEEYLGVNSKMINFGILENI